MSAAVEPLVAQPEASDLQPLFQQLVFECKVHAALHGAAFAAIAHAFHRWLHCDPIQLPHKALANEPPPQRVKAAMDTSPLTDSSPPKATGASALSASNELTAFRIAREDLRREAAAAAQAREASAASPDGADAEVVTPLKASSSDGNELASARRRVAAWQAALRHVVVTLETETGRRRHEDAPPAEALADAGAAEACRAALSAIMERQAEESSLRDALVGERERAADARLESARADSRASKVGHRLQTVEARMEDAEERAKARETSARVSEEAHAALLQRVQHAEATAAARSDEARASQLEISQLKDRLESAEATARSARDATQKSAAGRKEALDAAAAAAAAAASRDESAEAAAVAAVAAAAEAAAARDMAVHGLSEAEERLRRGEAAWHGRETALCTELAKSREDIKASKRAEAESQMAAAAARAEAARLAEQLGQATQRSVAEAAQMETLRMQLEVESKATRESDAGVALADSVASRAIVCAEAADAIVDSVSPPTALTSAAMATVAEALGARDRALERLRQSEHEGQLLMRQMEQRGQMLAEREAMAAAVDVRHRETAARELLKKMTTAQRLVAQRAVMASRRLLLGQCLRALALNAAANRCLAEYARPAAPPPHAMLGSSTSA